MTSSPMELDVWKGDWGLASGDLKCLQVLVQDFNVMFVALLCPVFNTYLAYSKFCGAPVKVNNTNNPFWSPSGTLPVFRHGKTVITSFQEVVSYLDKKKFSANHNLTAKQLADSIAFSHLLEEKLLPGFKYTWWMDQKNFVEVTRPWYAKALPFPLNFYYPGKYETETKQLVETMFSDEDDISHIENELFRQAEKCLTALALHLGDKPFFFGSSPTSLDAVVFGYLAPLLKAPFSRNTLQNHIKACPPLVSFVARISQKYFPEVQVSESKETEEKLEAKEAKSERWRKIFFFSSAITAMTGFAMYTNVLKDVQFKKNEDYTQEFHEIFSEPDED